MPPTPTNPSPYPKQNPVLFFNFFKKYQRLFLGHAKK